jgi:hypothetical protein
VAGGGVGGGFGRADELGGFALVEFCVMNHVNP